MSTLRTLPAKNPGRFSPQKQIVKTSHSSICSLDRIVIKHSVRTKRRQCANMWMSLKVNTKSSSGYADAYSQSKKVVCRIDMTTINKKIQNIPYESYSTLNHSDAQTRSSVAEERFHSSLTVPPESTPPLSRQSPSLAHWYCRRSGLA